MRWKSVHFDIEEYIDTNYDENDERIEIPEDEQDEKIFNEMKRRQKFASNLEYNTVFFCVDIRCSECIDISTYPMMQEKQFVCSYSSFNHDSYNNIFSLY
jgi:hypothetical protein